MGDVSFFCDGFFEGDVSFFCDSFFERRKDGNGIIDMDDFWVLVDDTTEEDEDGTLLLRLLLLVENFVLNFLTEGRFILFIVILFFSNLTMFVYYVLSIVL